MKRRSFIKTSGSAALLTYGGLLTQAGKAYPVNSKKVIRMGIAGGHFGASFQWHEHPNCKVTGVTDLIPDRRQILKETYQCNTAYDSLEEMVEKAEDIDAVGIFTPPPDHVKHTRLCMERGWHVISAVPACFTIEEARELKELKESTGLKYMMAETSWYYPGCIFARNAYREGLLGDIVYSESEYYHDRNVIRLINDSDVDKSWRRGYPPLNYPTHGTGFLIGVTGERIVKVSGLGWGGDHLPFDHDNDYDNPFWNEASLMLTDKGNIHRCNMFKLYAGFGERARWWGNKATLFMANRLRWGSEEGFNPEVLKIRPENPYDEWKDEQLVFPEYYKSDMLPEPMRHTSSHENSHPFLTAEFINALLEDREPVIDVYEALAMTVPGIIAHQSALNSGRQLDVPQ